MILFPPYAKKGNKIQYSHLPNLESLGIYLCQRKFNGDRAVFKRHASGKNEIYYGHSGQPFKNWRAPTVLLQELAAIKLPPKKESFLDGELIRSTNTIIFYDILQYGEYLTGVKQAQRLEILATSCGNPHCDDPNPILALRVSDHILLAQHWDQDFVRHYMECIESPLVEGLMLRKRESYLDNFGRSPYDVAWQIRVRKESKKYRH